MSKPRSTIFALSSGRPPAAIAVIRISGPNAGEALRAMAGRVPEPRKGMFARLRDPQSREMIDEALALWFPGPNSETGEDTVELQIHGGRAVIEATYAALSRLPDFRLAEPGEFTRRGFENGKLDLTRVEGLADLIAADSDAQRRQALRQLQGLLGDKAETWRKSLIEALALIEAQIDFPDEGDVPADLETPALVVVKKLRDEIAEVLGQGDRGERLREGMVVAIAGPPNAGKSSLLNRLARREAAIVSPFAGTTRDVIEVHLDLGGYPVVLMDTAGIRVSDDPVEQEGIRRAQARAEAADLVLWVTETRSEEMNINSANESQFTEIWTVKNKVDIRVIPNIKNNDSKLYNNAHALFAISAKTGEGIPELLAALSQKAADFFGATEITFITRRRQREDLTQTSKALERALDPALRHEMDLIAEELRLATRSLGRLTGRVDVEDVLDVIFRDFCIGK
jgi:tRNA modification GTPase